MRVYLEISGEPDARRVLVYGLSPSDRYALSVDQAETLAKDLTAAVAAQRRMSIEAYAAAVIAAASAHEDPEKETTT